MSKFGAAVCSAVEAEEESRNRSKTRRADQTLPTAHARTRRFTG